MAGDPNSGARSPAVQQALSVVNLGLQAATAYKRSDLVDRLKNTQRRLADPAFHVFVVGEFKQGKSSLVNALLNAPVCPVDDDIATSAPTAVGYGEEAKAAVLFKPPESEDRDGTGDPPEPIREEIAVDQVAQYVTEAANPANQHRVSSVEVKMPRKLLADGLVIVDTPGVGGLGSAHSAATIGALPMADAVIFVSDASQEFTAPELDFLQTARRMCSNVVCVLTKTDFYPAWRKIRDLDTGHLERIGIETGLLTVSSALRIHALRSNDRQLNQESGFPSLVNYLQNDIAANAESLTVRNAAADLVAVTGLIESQFRNEREALTDPERATALVENLTEVKERANRLRSGVSKWQQTLNDGIQDLQADLDHELRGRIRQITKAADESIENTDPGDAWDDFQAWLYRRMAEDVVHTYASLHARARELTMRVNEHFGEDGGEVAINLAVMNPSEVLGAVDNGADLDPRTASVGAQSLTALRSSYGGVMMFGMLAKTAGLAMMNPATLVLGLFMGRSALKGEKERALAQRRGQAKQAHRKYTDEVTFVVAKDARDTLRRVQRQLRDFFASRAEELHKSTTEALNGAQKAVKSDEATRQARLKDVEAELTRIGRLHKRAVELDQQAASATSGDTAGAGAGARAGTGAGGAPQGGQQR